MKRLLLLAPMLLLSGCGKYGSMTEAQDACQSWSEKGGSYTWDIGPRPSWDSGRYLHIRFQEWPVRNCRTEKETRQVLGLIGPYAKGSTTKNRPWEIWQGKVKARFRY